MKLLPIRSTRTSVLLLALGAAFVSSACAPLMLGGAMMGGAIVATDRRTSGTQVEDEGIEFKAAARIREQLGDKGHVNVNAYNRMVLLTGEVASESRTRPHREDRQRGRERAPCAQ